MPPGGATHTVAATDFARDIAPLFRPIDVDHMGPNGLGIVDLASPTDVRDKIDHIIGALRAKRMPPPRTHPGTRTRSHCSNNGAPTTSPHRTETRLTAGSVAIRIARDTVGRTPTVGVLPVAHHTTGCSTTIHHCPNAIHIARRVRGQATPRSRPGDRHARRWPVRSSV